MTTKVVSVEMLHGQPNYTGPWRTGILDFEQEPQQWKYAQLEVRGPDTQMGGMQVAVEAKSWDDVSWTPLGTMYAPMNHQAHFLNIALNPSKELVRYSVWTGSGAAEVYVKLTLSDEENENE